MTIFTIRQSTNGEVITIEECNPTLAEVIHTHLMNNLYRNEYTFRVAYIIGGM